MNFFTWLHIENRVRSLFIAIGVWVVFSVTQAQETLIYDDHVYLEHIKSVKLHHAGLVTSEPIIDLRSGGSLELTFDDILGGDRNYTYRIIHCDKDWRPSDLDEMEYLEGFNDEDINDFDYSIGTKLDYTHYRLRIPNRNVAWTVSGNYLLVVTDDDSDELALSRRFMVVERKVTIRGEPTRPIKAALVNTHHEIDFSINHKNFHIANPQREIFVTVLQNGRWDRSITNIQPKFATGDELNFGRTNQINFAAGREFRGADLRSTRSATPGIHSIEVREDGYDIILGLDRSRRFQADFDYEDLNGDYIIETLDDNQDAVKSEYVDGYFALYSRDPLVDGDVCLVGKFNGWKCREGSEMTYDYDNQYYFTSLLLKQGYYDYQYALKTTEGLDYGYFEGNHFSTSNDYTILVYLRSFSERYDRLIGATAIVADF